MAKKITTSNNYFVIEDTVSGEIIKLPKNRCRYTINTTHVRIIDYDAINTPEALPIADIIDSGDLPFASTAALETFLESNTGAA